MKFKNAKKTPKQAKALEKKKETLRRKVQQKELHNSQSQKREETVKKAEKTSLVITSCEKEKKEFQFPNNYRFITERRIWVFILCVLAAVSCLFLAIDITLRNHTLAQITQGRKELASKEAYWKAVTIQKPGYRDGYIQVAQYAYMLGDFDTAYQYVEKTLMLDPNFLPALQLKGVLQTKGER